MIKLLITFILCLQLTYAIENITLEITEIFPDPKGKDNSDINNLEFIELHNYGDKILDLNGAKIYTNKNKSFNVFELYKELKPDEFLILYPSRYFNLKNKGNEKIVLTYNDFLIDEVSYSYSEEGLSLTKSNDIWIFEKPTPGMENNKKEELFNDSFEPLANKKSESFLNVSNNKSKEVVYESVILKQRIFGLYFFLFTLIITLISLIIEYGRRKGNQGKSNN